jgi:hypothetical protein
MSKKAELIDKDCVLLYFSDYGKKLNKIESDKMYLFKETYSLRYKNDTGYERRCYCTNENFYSCNDYALILDLEFFNEAKQEFLDCQLNIFKQEENRFNKMKLLYENKIKMINGY